MTRARIISVLMVVSLLPVLLFYGCGKNKPGSPGDKVVLKINKYEMTAEDFKDEARLTMPNQYLSTDPDKAKEELLDEIITRQVLIQEAQQKNFDKDKAFRKEIERYWEQALLKLLLKEKMRELSGQIAVRKDETMETRQMKIREALDRWIKSLRRTAHIKIYKENLKGVELK